jgi:hypothetical protein
MVKKLTASELYKQGLFNVANIIVELDGTTTVTCDGPLAPRPYTFRARHFLSPDEQLLDDPEVEVPDADSGNRSP